MTSTPDIHWWDATELALQIRAKTVSATQVLEHFLARVARLNPKLNCIICLDETAARERAAAADAALANGELWGPLHGVPMTIKDTIEVAGMPCTAGVPQLKDHRPGRTAAAAQRLIDAGAIVFGKTNVPPMASDLQTRNDVFGITGNAWNPGRIAGGSSGGSAVALAAGLTALELGSDIGGSSRNPAHYNSVFGMRPTWGTIPGIGHIPGMPGSLIVEEFGSLGPLARSARDLRLAFDLVRGSEPLFGAVIKPTLPEKPITDIGPLRVGCWLDDEYGLLDDAVRDVLLSAVESLRRAGLKFVDDAKPDFDPWAAYLAYIRMGGAITGTGTPPQERVLMRQQLAVMESDPDNADSGLHRMKGVLMTFGDWQKDNEIRGAIRVKWAEYFRKYDVMISPIIGVAALEHGVNFFTRTIQINGQPKPGRDQLFWAAPQVIASLPSVVFPAGFTQEGLPVGMQITTGHHEDYQAIRIAELFADVLGFAQRHPPLP